MEPGPLDNYIQWMATMGFQRRDFPPSRPETDTERRCRIECEEAIIAKAESDINAGLGIEDEDVEAWLDLLDQDADTPLPAPRSAPAFR